MRMRAAGGGPADKVAVELLQFWEAVEQSYEFGVGAERSESETKNQDLCEGGEKDSEARMEWDVR